MKVSKISAVGAIVLLLSVVISAQTSADPAVKAAANDAFQKKDWVSAAANYQKIVSVEEKNAGAHYRLGVALLNLDRADDAH